MLIWFFVCWMYAQLFTCSLYQLHRVIIFYFIWLHSNIVFFRHRYLSKCRQRDVTTRYFMCRKCFIYGKYQPEMWSKEKELLTRVISLHHHSTIIQRKRQKNTIFFTGSSRSEMQCSHSLGLYLLFVAHEIQYPLWCVLLYFDELGTAH